MPGPQPAVEGPGGRTLQRIIKPLHGALDDVTVATLRPAHFRRIHGNRRVWGEQRLCQEERLQAASVSPTHKSQQKQQQNKLTPPAEL